MSKYAGPFFLVAALASAIAGSPDSYTLGALGLGVVAYALRARDTVQR
ncbi:MAG TPA: hypothetical protein VN279_08160 [Rhodocyclaceae bacterium]|jgi:hypothetical protein|nr:hypothetical protein [Rhodocyclaceae bacterium]